MHTEEIEFIVVSISEGVEMFNELLKLEIGDVFSQESLISGSIASKLKDTIMDNSFGFILRNNQGTVSDTLYHSFEFNGIVTSLNDQEAIKYQLIPNPATSYITISEGYTGAIEVYSVLGSLVLQEENYTQNSKVSLSTLVSGIYIVRLENGQVFKFEKN